MLRVKKLNCGTALYHFLHLTCNVIAVSWSSFADQGKYFLASLRTVWDIGHIWGLFSYKAVLIK